MIIEQTRTMSFHPPVAVRALYAPKDLPTRPFTDSTPLVPADLVDRLLERTRTRDTRYDATIAYALSVISTWAYSDGQTLANKLRYYGLPFATVEEISVTNSALFVMTSSFFIRSACGRVGVLAFRGTELTSVVNWLGDTNVQMRSIAHGRVHAGFYEALVAVWDEVVEQLQRANQGEPRDDAAGRAPLETLLVTGHSLGGALSLLAATKLIEPQSPISAHKLLGVYTYGQPAIGDASFASYYRPLLGEKLYRHIYGLDVVPHLPPRTTGKFEHIGRERISAKLSESWMEPAQLHSVQSGLITSTLSVALASFFARRLPLFTRLPLRYSVDDHLPGPYVEVSRSSLERQRMRAPDAQPSEIPSPAPPKPFAIS